MEIVPNLEDFLTTALKDLNCRADTRSYIIGIYLQNRTAQHDLSQSNLTVLYCQAKFNNDFYALQKIGDWIFFVQSTMPGHLTSETYYQDMARLSYYSCYKLIKRQWPLFNEMSDQFISLEQQAFNLLSKLRMPK